MLSCRKTSRAHFIDFKDILYNSPKFETEQFFEKICKILQGLGYKMRADAIVIVDVDVG